MIQRVACPRMVIGGAFYRFRSLPQCVTFAKLNMTLLYIQGVAHGRRN